MITQDADVKFSHQETEVREIIDCRKARLSAQNHENAKQNGKQANQKQGVTSHL